MDVTTHRNVLRELASGQHGIFTTAEAEEFDIPRPALSRLVRTGYLERVGHGAYRHREVARDGYTQLAARLAAAGRDTYLADETVLALQDLALVDPGVVHLVTTRRNRRDIPLDTYLRHDPDLPLDDMTRYHDLPSMTVYAALRSCLPRLVPERTLAAVRDAVRRGLIDRGEAQRIRTTLRRQREKMVTT